MNKFQLSYVLIVICLPKRCHAFIVINLKTRIKPERELYGTDGFVFLRPDDFSWTKRLAVYLCVTLDSEPAGSCLQSTNENNTKKNQLAEEFFFHIKEEAYLLGGGTWVMVCRPILKALRFYTRLSVLLNVFYF